MYPRTQTQIKDSLRYRSRDTNSTPRWDDTEVYGAINYALDRWAGRVLVPHIHSTDWSVNTREYALPAYVRKPIDPQYLFPGGGETTWMDFNAYSTRPSGSGSLILHMDFYPSAIGTGEGRVIFWSSNPQVPVEPPALLTAIDSDDTTIVLDENLEVGDVGYVKVDDEWIGYAGRSYGAGTTTLSNLERGAFDSTADSHDIGDTVYWGVVAHRADLFSQLEHQALAMLHEMFLSDGSAHEQETHERQLNWHQQQADVFWKSFVPARSPKILLSRGSTGEPLYTGSRVFPAAGDRSSYP